MAKRSRGQPSNKRIKELIDGGRRYNNDCIVPVFLELCERRRGHVLKYSF